MSIKKISPEQEIQELQKTIEQELDLVKKGEQEKKSIDPQTFLQISNLSRLIQRTLQKIEASQVYQTFKLSGTDYVVHDRREERAPANQTEKGKTIAEESKMSLEALLVQKGKLVPAKEKEIENYFADPAKKMKGPEQQAAEERLSRLFTRFEKTLLKRFEEGAKMVQEMGEGKSSFWKKTADQWRQFFGHFMQRTVKRQVSLDQIHEWTYRGLVQKEAKATVISDLAFTNGQIEKFIRFRLNQSARSLAERLASLEPGAKLGAVDLQEHSKEELEYLAIKNAEADTSWVQAPTRGKFLGTAQAEEKVASDLGLQLGAQLKEKERILRNLGRRKKGFGGIDLGDDEVPQIQQTVFIPWWGRPFQKRSGPVRWFVVAVYLVVLAGVVIGLVNLLK